MDKFFSSVQSFIHSVTTNDRYASYESQYRSSPNASGPGASTKYRRTPLGVTGSSDEFDDRSTGIGYLQSNSSSTSLNGNSSQTNLSSGSSSNNNSSSRVQYTPGMRSAQVGNNNIALQDYSDGLPPPPSPALSWKRIDRWVESNYPELYDQVSYPVTSADLNELESDLDCTLPLDVRDSYMVHDGQERGGRPTGLIFGITILDLEGISEEWTHWKNTAIRLNDVVRQQKQKSIRQPQPANNSQNPRSISGSSNTSTTGLVSSHHQQQQQSPQLTQHQFQLQQQKLKNTLNWIQRQESVPEGCIQLVYAHPAWIPLAKDFEGNNIAVDLAPGKNGRWGQVILFGRDFDRKYVIAPSWGSFLSTFADDLESSDHYIDDDLEEGSFMFKAPNGRVISYFEVLKSRVERTVRMNRKANGVSNGHTNGNTNGHIPTRISRPNTPGSTPPGRKLSSPKQPKLISPFQSTTNLSQVTTSPKPSASSENKESESESETKSKPTEESNTETESETTKSNTDLESKTESKSTSELVNESSNDSKPSSSPTKSTSTSDDEVDMLDDNDDELTDVHL